MTTKKRTNQKKKQGRLSIYDPIRYPAVAATLMRKGGTIEDIAKALVVSERTIYTWKKKYPEFLQAISESKISADAEVEHSLFLLTKDRTVTEVRKIFRNNPKTGEAELVGSEELEKVIPASLSAILVWLFNRTSDWKRNPDSENDNDPSKDPLYRMLAEIKDKVDPAPGGDKIPFQIRAV